MDTGRTHKRRRLAAVVLFAFLLFVVPLLAGLAFRHVDADRVMIVDLRGNFDSRQVQAGVDSEPDFDGTALVLVSSLAVPVPCGPGKPVADGEVRNAFCPTGPVRPIVLLNFSEAPVDELIDSVYGRSATSEKLGDKVRLVTYRESVQFGWGAAVATFVLLVAGGLLGFLLIRIGTVPDVRPVPTPPVDPVGRNFNNTGGDTPPRPDRPGGEEPAPRPPVISVAERLTFPVAGCTAPSLSGLRRVLERAGWTARTVTHLSGAGGYVAVDGVVLWVTADADAVPDEPVRLAESKSDGGLLATTATNPLHSSQDREPLP